MQKITPFLWFDNQAEEAANYYVSVFKNARIVTIARYSKEGAAASGQKEGSAMTVAFELDGQKFVALNGGPYYKINEAVSFVVNCETQEEIDHYWARLGDGGDPAAQRCGWLKDKFGVSWQIVPSMLPEVERRIAQIEALGFRGYGQRFDFTHTVPQILHLYGTIPVDDLADQPRVKISGRIQTVRRMGKAGFMHLLQGGERLQVYVKKDAVSERDYKLYELLDLGDIVGIDGYVFRTRTGELSVHAEQITFLSKILMTMPEKFHGIEDVELRYRQRYLDLIANPISHRVFLTRAKIVSSIRRQLESRGFVEVETPMMQAIYGGAAARRLMVVLLSASTGFAL